MNNKIESIVIVTSKVGSVATLRFTDPKVDKIFSTQDASEDSKNKLYKKVVGYVQGLK